MSALALEPAESQRRTRPLTRLDLEHHLLGGTPTTGASVDILKNDKDILINDSSLW